MSNTVNISLYPSETSDMGRAGLPTSAGQKTFQISQTGTLHLTALGYEAKGPSGGGPEPPVLKPGQAEHGGAPTNHPPQITLLPLKYVVTDPNGVTFPASAAGQYEITMDTLARYRDANDLSTGVWTLHFTNPVTDVGMTDINMSASLASVEPNLSVPPAINMTGANALGLQPGGVLTLDLVVNALGTLTITAAPIGASAVIGLVLLSPNGRMLASGNNKIQLAIGLRDLHLIRNEGPLCHLKITAPTTPAGLKCNLTAQFSATNRMQDSTLQQRLTAIFGTAAPNDYMAVYVDWDKDKQMNVVSLKIVEPAFTTLDNFGFIDTFEDMDFANQQTHYAKNPKLPKPVRRYMDPGVKFPVYEVLLSPHQLHNFQTESILVTVGQQPGTLNTGSIPLITVKVIFLPYVDGDKSKQPEVHNGALETASIENPVITLPIEIVINPTLGITLQAPNATFTFHANLQNLPDGAAHLGGGGSLSDQVMAPFNDFIKSLPKIAAAPLQSILTTLMGGLFTFESVDYENGGTNFNFIPGAEEQPRTLDPSYLPRGLARPTIAPTWNSPNAAKIDHIVILMMENRSFDHVLGYLPLTGGRSDVEGLSQTLINSFNEGGRPYLLPSTVFPFDPSHAFPSVKIQMGPDLSGKGPMRGFMLAFLQDYPFMAFDGNSPQRKTQDDPYWYPQRKDFTVSAIMGYHDQKNLPYYSFLAKEYMICDHWYASHPGPTFPNRFFYLGGRLARDRFNEPMEDNDISSLRLLRQRTIQDALTERGVGWKLYESPPDVAMLRMYARYAFDEQNIRPISEFFTTARAGQLPSVTFLEPNFHVGVDTNDDHPPCDMHNGQKLIQNVYEALTANAAAWEKTMFLICYDEHGGLHDHVYPDIADHVQATGKPALETRYGVRIPAMVISPWVPAGSCTKEIFDHTSILKTIINRFSPNDPVIMSDRMAWANDFFSLLTLPAPRPLNQISTFGGVTIAPVIAHEVGEAHAAGGQAAVKAEEPVSKRLLRQPILRNKDLFQDKTDFHEYMGKLSSLLR